MLAALVSPAPLRAQQQGEDLIDLYRSALYRVQAQHMLGQDSLLLAPLPAEFLPAARADSIRAWLAQKQSGGAAESVPPAPAFEITDLQVVGRLERPWFEEEFAGVRWAYLGTPGHTLLDTTLTRELRARLEAHFGSPTQTLADLDHRRGRLYDEYIQFEYWFVLNDTIPLMVMDTGGPFDRGLVLVGDARHRDRLPAIREALLAPVARSPERAPYVDYFFDREGRAWYRAGFDGEEFFLKRISRPRLIPGRRPWLEDQEQ